MLDRCDRVQIAVHDVAEAFLRYKQLLGCDLYAGLFGLDPARFGDVGTLTLFDPPKPARPCRAQPRRGSCHGLLRQEARRFALYTPRGSDPVTDPDE
jgi:hypothetical protein